MLSHEVLFRILSLSVGYLFGCILTAEIVTHRKTGKSAREIGSGNPGMANVMTQLGFKSGIATLGGDMLKTFAACILCRFILFSSIGIIAGLYAGIGCMLGHNFPFWNGFHGGKGVAVTCTAIFFFSPLWGLLSCICGLIGVLCTKYLPIGAIIITTAFILPCGLFYGTEACILAVCLDLMMLNRHFPGLKNIPTGTEPRIDLIAKLSKKHS